MKLNKFFLNLSVFLTAIFGVFTLYIWFFQLFDLNFYSLVSYLWAPVIISSVFIAYLINKPIQWHGIECLPIKSGSKSQFVINKLTVSSCLFLAVSVLLIIRGVDETFMIPWLLLVVGIGSVFFCFYQNIPETIVTSESERGEGERLLYEVIGLACLGLTLITLYLFSTSTNADDTHFVSYIISLIHHPNSILFITDSIFNNGGGNFVYTLNFGQSWEALSAVISKVTGVDHLYIYYLYLPSLFLFFVPVPLYYFTKVYFPKYALISTFFALIMLVCWSNYNHMHGMFFIPRFYQGKSILICFFLPLLFVVSRSFFLNPNIKLGVITCLTLISAGGSSSTGLYISILVFGLCFLCFTPLNWKSIKCRAGLLLLVLLPNLVMLVTVKGQISSMEEIKTTYSKEDVKLDSIPSHNLNDLTKEHNRPIRSMYWLFGDNLYLAIFMLMFLVTFFVFYLDNNPLGAELKRLYFVMALLAFNHPLAAFLNDTVGPGNLVWRFHWIIPMGFIFSLFSASLLSFSSNFSANNVIPSHLQTIPSWVIKWTLISPIIIVVSAFVFLNINHLSTKFTNKVVPIKVNGDALSIAKYLITDLNKSDKILAVNSVAEILPMLHHESELITSRPLYWGLPYFNLEETRTRKYLQHLINDLSLWSEADHEFFKAELKKKNITTLVYKQTTELKEVENNNFFPDFNCSSHNENWMICKNKLHVSIQTTGL